MSSASDAMILELDNVGSVAGQRDNAGIRRHAPVVLKTNGCVPGKHERWIGDYRRPSIAKGGRTILDIVEVDLGVLCVPSNRLNLC